MALLYKLLCIFIKKKKERETTIWNAHATRSLLLLLSFLFGCVEYYNAWAQVSQTAFFLSICKPTNMRRLFFTIKMPRLSETKIMKNVDTVIIQWLLIYCWNALEKRSDNMWRNPLRWWYHTTPYVLESHVIIICYLYPRVKRHYMSQNSNFTGEMVFFTSKKVDMVLFSIVLFPLL